MVLIQYTQDFEIFWKAYPRKTGKGKAFESWLKIKPTAELQVVILRAIAEQRKSKEWQKDEGQYIPMPSTWLNQGRWDDELTPANISVKKIRLFPIQGKVCGKSGCGMPAVYKQSGDYDHYLCKDHLPEKVKTQYE